nr:aminotransferase class I/II-fold pyridoxal phosphate-dependent enzyme [Gehongia tenuis]
MIAPHVAAVPPSGIRKFFDIVSTMKDAISLGVGEPDFTTPWNICEAAIYAIEKGVTHYSSNWGTLELRQAIAEYLTDRCDVHYDPRDEIMVTVGASEGIDLALRAILSPGDEVLVPDPGYVSYVPGVLFAHGVPVSVPTRPEVDFRLTPEDLKGRITPKTKALILPYPNNPTGAIMAREDLEAIAEVLKGTDILVLSDEIYSELTYGQKHVSFASIEGMKERTILLNGFSKAFAMTGWRLGYLCAPRELAAAIVKIHQYTILCAPVAGQAAAAEALKSAKMTDYRDVKKMLRTYDYRRRMLLKAFREMGLPCFEPKGAFYMFPNITSTGMDSETFCEELLRQQKVAVVPGTAFGESGEGFVRCSYATATEDIQEAIRRIGEFVKSHRR